jgi:hypothetical protein
MAAPARNIAIQSDLEGIPLPEEQMDLVLSTAIDAGEVGGGEQPCQALHGRAL